MSNADALLAVHFPSVSATLLVIISVKWHVELFDCKPLVIYFLCFSSMIVRMYAVKISFLLLVRVLRNGPKYGANAPYKTTKILKGKHFSKPQQC